MPTYDREDDTSRKEYRKPYILSEGGYQDMMRTTWDKSVWNEILEIDPVWAEFLFTRADLPDAATAAEIRYLRYIKQSEFKKQFGNNFDYNEMEYVWEGFLPTWDDNFNPPYQLCAMQTLVLVPEPMTAIAQVWTQMSPLQEIGL
jgi:hypothetical protein